MNTNVACGGTSWDGTGNYGDYVKACGEGEACNVDGTCGVVCPSGTTVNKNGVCITDCCAGKNVDLIPHVVHNCYNNCVDTTIINGKIMMENRKLKINVGK